MDIQSLKEYICDNNAVECVLEQLGCHHIKDKGSYYTCGNPDGDNVSAITVYKDESLNVIDYTRAIADGKRVSDIIDLVQFFTHQSFFEAVKSVCEWIGLDLYHDFEEDLPQSIGVLKLLLEMDSNGATGFEDDTPIKPIPEAILTYYLPFVNDMFANDGICYSTQREFEVGYDDYSNRITIPVRDEHGTLVGVKGRYFGDVQNTDILKYIYLEPTNRSQILYGLYKTYTHIQNKRVVYVVEAEKGVMQLWSAGIFNSVATSGKKVSQQQIEKLTRLGAAVVFCFDRDVGKDELQDLADRFPDGVDIYALIDKNNILLEKQSPTDDIEKFKSLEQNQKVKLK